jgi:hypothetical protein
LIALTENCKLDLPTAMGTKMDCRDTLKVKSGGGGVVIEL